MRPLISVVIVLALVALAGCSDQPEPAPEQPKAEEAQTDPQPIASEDFESGTPEGAVQGDDESAEDDEGGETP